ncbi:unnamed protein product [Lymnaea stagnalis]|uniref:Uncharacterized protein n=1 Tax=Lymnaea stagnalis TaxID=6523 RepID=A0AAV2ID70_LYMST
MTSRHQNISPPDQIQQRHVNTGVSTPPPQPQFYSAFQPNLEFNPIQQQPPALYKAYGSVVNESRAPSNGARVGPPQPNLQTGASFYSQPNQNMRPPQPQQPPATQQYFISTPAQPGLRPRQQQMTPQPAMVYIQQYNQGNNVVIPNMYAPRYPVYQPQPTQGYSTYPAMYYNNGWPNPGIPQATAPIRPPQAREKRIISITDPESGRNITDEIINNRQHSVDSEEHSEDMPAVNTSNQEICKIFTRLVADRLKPPEETNSVTDTQSGAVGASSASVQSSQYQQPPPQQVQQANPAHAAATLIRPNMSHMMRPDLTQPPPQIRQSTPAPLYPQQVPTLHGPRMNQLQQPPRPQMPQISGVQQTAPVVQHQVPLVSQTPSAPHVPQPFSSVQVADFVPLAAKPEASAPNVDKVNPTTEATPQDIPAKPVAAAPVQISKTPSPTSPAEEPIFPEQPEPTVIDSKSNVNQASKDTIPSFEETHNPDDGSKEESSLGASQVPKDGKKNKKSKKDINRKEIVGTEMDAFIDDKENEESASKPPLPPGAGDRKGSLDKTMTQETKAVINSTPEATKEVVREASPQPPVLTDTAPAQPIKINEKLSISEPEHVSPVSVQDTQSISQIIQEAPNQNQSLVEQPGSSIRNKKPPGQTERQNSQHFDNGMYTDKVNKANDLESDSQNVNHVTVSEENEVETDVLNKAKVDDGKKGGLIEDNIITSKSVSEKTPLKGKKDGKDKLIYDRAHLMELRECPASQAKPEGLPNLEIILDRPNNNTTRSTTDAPDFTPGFFQQATSNNQRHPPQIGKTSSRGRQRPGDGQQMRIIKSVSLQNDVKPLHQSEKPWKPKEKQLSAGESAENRKSLESEVLFIMNRLTPTNFERLATEMRKLNIQTYEDLQELVKIFFDKVTMETKFVEAYALLCKVMSGLKVPPPPGMKDNQATFRVVMLTKCQQEFEADKSIIFEDPEEKKRKIESEMPEGNERNQLIETTLYLMKLKRLKFYGNIRFIGELFKLGMLTENIMHDCIYRLLKARDDDSLVSLCQLLTTVGHALDTDKAKARMDQYFHQMAKIAEERKSRIKFTLKDAIDLRSNNWVPRKEQTGPKKIDEVHKDFQQEQFTKQLMQSQPLPPRNDQAQPNSRRGSRQRQDEIKQPLDDGWNTVGSKSLRIDASKMKLSKNVVDENSIQLGPGGGTSKFSMWGRGSLGAQQLSQDDRPAPAANRFSLLRGGEEDRRNFQRSPSRGDSVANRGVRQGPTAGHGRGKILSRSSTEGERKEALANARSIVGGRSQNSSRDNSWNREEHRQFLGPRGSREGDNVMTRSDIALRPGRDSLLPPNVSPASVASTGGYDNEPIVKKLKPLSVDEMEQKAKTILEEYLSVKDLEEAKLCLRELEGQTHLDVLVSACINNVLEKTKRERELTGQFFHEMVKNKLIPLELYLKGLTEVLQYGEDMVIDIPMIWAYLAELIAPLLIGGSVPLLNLSQALQSNLERKCCAKLLAEILIIAKEKTNDDELAQMWQSSGLSWSGFIDEADIDRFLHEKKLTCTVAPLSAANISSRGVGSSKFDFDRVVKDIEKIAKDGGSSKDVITYVEKNIPVDSRDKDFIRALTTAIASHNIFNYIIPAAMKANEDMIKNHKDTLHNYIKSNQELELQALYAIQALMHRLEHPSGVIVSLFEVLYDEEVISEEACKRWEKSTDPLEAEGKGACSMQLTHFFAWLRENDEPDASS